MLGQGGCNACDVVVYEPHNPHCLSPDSECPQNFFPKYERDSLTGSRYVVRTYCFLTIVLSLRFYIKCKWYINDCYYSGSENKVDWRKLARMKTVKLGNNQIQSGCFIPDLYCTGLSFFIFLEFWDWCQSNSSKRYFECIALYEAISLQ